jgi:hypothetical protein
VKVVDCNFAKVLHAIQLNWCYWLTLTGMRLIPISFFLGIKAFYSFKKLICPNFDLFVKHSYFYAVVFAPIFVSIQSERESYKPVLNKTQQKMSPEALK